MIDPDARAEILDQAALMARPVARLSPETPLSVDVAYAVQERLVARRLARGERIAGLKLGLTSETKMKQVGVREVILGRLTDAMQHDEGSSIDLGRLIHPRIEPEIAFLLRRPLPPDPSQAEVQVCVEAVAPALEIIDSRYEGFRFDLGDVIADNASSAGFVLGRLHPPETDTGDIAITLALSGEVRETGSSAAILGRPLNALAAAARIAAARGISTSPGDIVLAGAATAAVPLSARTRVIADFGPLGRMEIRADGPGEREN
ncbi:2-keto-4-pentenoate hydratase [Pannonibacter phragmitetus]|jgi:2-oxo-3-hexenedioate decarboxylase|uniref:2-keto-4-pentenoate hydratase n=1 Tax=Pannonibacter phragmitetus TaxID=121719 RepID=UPI00067E06C4|nr:fumarylacetoacetate hydrolase family protein [Pannonibacter phragmitetus]